MTEIHADFSIEAGLLKLQNWVRPRPREACAGGGAAVFLEREVPVIY